MPQNWIGGKFPLLSGTIGLEALSRDAAYVAASQGRMDTAIDNLANALVMSDHVCVTTYVSSIVGTVDQMVEDLQARRERWGISYYVVREPDVDDFAPVVARLAGR